MEENEEIIPIRQQIKELKDQIEGKTKPDKPKRDKYGWNIGMIIGACVGFVAFIVSIFMVKLLYAAGVGLGIGAVIAFFVANLRWQQWIPFSAKVGKRKARQGYVIIEKINESGQITFERQKIEEGTTMIDGIPRLATPAEVLFYKRRPVIIQPSWSTIPFSKSDNFDKISALGYGTKGWKLLYNRIKNEGIVDKKKISGMTIAIVLIVVAGLGLLAWKSGWL